VYKIALGARAIEL